MRRILTIVFIAANMHAAPGTILGQDSSVKLVVSDIDGYQRLEPVPGAYLFSAAVGVVQFELSGSSPSQYALSIPGYYSHGEEGAPSLPGYSILFEADGKNQVQLHIEAMDSVIIDLNEEGFEGILQPFQASEQKDSALPSIKMDSAVYNRDAWTGGPVVSTLYEGKMRGLPMSTLHFNPVKYHPVRNLLKIYYNVRCHIESGQVFYPEPEPAFSALFSRVVRHKPAAKFKALASEEPMTLVILSDTMFRETLKPYVEWKTRKGFRVLELYRGDSLVGSNRESMKASLKNLYMDPPPGIARPSYLLIVGDTEHIPLSQASGEVTDLYYAEYDGEGDYIPELFYGRISVSSSEQLQGVLEKILEYEQYQFPDPAFLDQSVLIAGVDGSYASTYGNGQINYAHDQYLNAENGIVAHMFRYPESDTSRQTILDLISSGVGFVNYTGHGEVDSWRDPAFRSSDVDLLQNLGKYPVIIGNGCETNYFKATECFAEALLRAREKGALAYIGCTNDSYWDEDYFWAVGVGPVRANPAYEETGLGYYDKVFHTHQEMHALWSPSLGEMVFGGNMAVQQSSSIRKKFYWEIYQLAGDPSIVPWFKQAAAQEVVLPEWLPPGAGRVDVRCAPYSYLAISQNGILLDALHASDQGYATLHLPDSLSTEKLELVISGDYYRPYIKEIEITGGEQSYMELLDYELSSESLAEDRHINPGERASLNLQLINRGSVAVTQDTLLLFSSHSAIRIVDSLIVLESIEAGDSLELVDVFRLEALEQLTDLDDAVLGIQSKGSGTPFYLREVFYAPVLESRGISWEDRSLGNGNGIPEQGEWLLCSWRLYNRGHFKTGEVHGILDISLSGLVDEVIFLNQASLEAGDSVVLQFEIKLGSVSKGWLGPGLLSAGDLSGSVSDSIFLTPGRYLDDFSLGKTGRMAYVDNATTPWLISDESYASSAYSLRSGNIGDSQTSEVAILFETTEDDTLSFSYRVSSESFYDYLRFFVDSSMVQQWSGETGWGRYSVFLEAGRHEIVWAYVKDSNISQREDAAWIDDIIFPRSAFRKADLSLMEITQPESGAWLTKQEQVKARVSNTSVDTVMGFTIYFSIDGLPFSEVNFDGGLDPGQEVEITAGERVDLSGFGSHMLAAELVFEPLGYSGNNRLEKQVVHQVLHELSVSSPEMIQNNGVFALAQVQAENTGNMPLDSMFFTIWMEALPLRSGALFLGLEPGQQSGLTFALVDSLDQLAPGLYDYVIGLGDRDSSLWYNQVEGQLLWYAPGLGHRVQALDWTLYPNPARLGFRVLLHQAAEKNILFELISLDGRIAHTFTIHRGDDQQWIPTGSFVPGPYLLRNTGTLKSVLLVIEH